MLTEAWYFPKDYSFFRWNYKQEHVSGMVNPFDPFQVAAMRLMNPTKTYSVNKFEKIILGLMPKFTPKHFAPLFVNNRWRPRAVSPLQEARYRRLALMAGLDPVQDIGLPPGPEHDVDPGVRYTRLVRPHENDKGRPLKYECASTHVFLILFTDKRESSNC